MKKFLLFLMILFFPLKSFSLIEVDITRGNLNPLPIAVSPLSIDEKSRKSFETLLKKRDIGEEISSIVENNLKTSGLFNPLVFEKIGLYPVNSHIKKFDGFTNCEDWMTARAEQNGLIDTLVKPQVPSIASIWNDPRGMHCLVRGDKRCGYYIPPKDVSDLYYRIVCYEKHKELEIEDMPCSFKETAVPLGWSVLEGDDGEMIKFDRARIALEGPFFNFDGSPYDV